MIAFDSKGLNFILGSSNKLSSVCLCVCVKWLVLQSVYSDVKGFSCILTVRKSGLKSCRFSGRCYSLMWVGGCWWLHCMPVCAVFLHVSQLKCHTAGLSAPSSEQGALPALYVPLSEAKQGKVYV